MDETLIVAINADASGFEASTWARPRHKPESDGSKKAPHSGIGKIRS